MENSRCNSYSTSIDYRRSDSSTKLHIRKPSSSLFSSKREKGNKKLGDMSSNKSRWTKYIFISIFLISIVWLLLPDERNPLPIGQVSNYFKDKYNHLKGKEDTRGISQEISQKVTPEIPGISISKPISDTSTPLTSKYCKSPIPGKPLIQYALMMDAGSTGSRIHVYKFNYCGKSPMLEGEYYDHLQPGLSKYENDPQKAAESLNPLLENALKQVPKELHYCTPIALKATAGLRMIGEEKSLKIINQVKKHLETFPFPIWDEEGVAIMDGKDEGVYAWITVNYLLDNLGQDHKVPTVAVMDLGGGSTQIVFEPKMELIEMEEGDHKYKLEFGGFTYTLYQHSYLFYGLKAARKNVHKLVAGKFRDNHNIQSWNDAHIPHPCLLRGVKKKVELDLPLEETNLINFSGTGGGATLCRQLAIETLNKTSFCPVPPCAFNGVYQPPISTSFSSDIYAFSYFYDRTNPLGMPSNFRLDELLDMTIAICDGDWEKFSHLDPEILDDIKSKEAYCLDLSFIFSLLHDGYEFDMKRMIRTAKKIRDAETGWALGASLALVSWYTHSGTCKITEEQ